MQVFSVGKYTRPPNLFIILNLTTMNSTVKTLLGITIGAAAGFVAGMLLAPDSGKKTRQRIADKARGMKEEADQVVHRAKHIKDGVVDETERYGKRLTEVFTN